MSIAGPQPLSYPHLERVFEGLNARTPAPTPEALRPFIQAEKTVILETEDVSAFLEAAVEDRVTLLRATGLFARWVRSKRMPVVARGESISEAIGSGYALGLTFPVDHIAYLYYLPDAETGSGFQARIQVIYTRQYMYPFDKDLFNANVIVEGAPVTYRDGVMPRTGYLVTTDVRYNAQTVEYTNVAGILGQKRGALGFLQKMLFFLPKTLYGLTLVDGDLVIDAFVNQTIERFEREPRYRVRRR